MRKNFRRSVRIAGGLVALAGLLLDASSTVRSPTAAFAAFVDEARKIVQRHGCDLLNVTLRDIEPDADTFLCDADQRMIAAVFPVDTERSPRATRACERSRAS